jgi:hypothetical protein
VSLFKTTDAARPPRHSRLDPLGTFVDSAHHEEIALGGPEKVQVSHFDAITIKWDMPPRCESSGPWALPWRWRRASGDRPGSSWRAARTGFMSGNELALAVGAIVALVAAVLVLVALPSHAPPAPPSFDGPDQ